MKKLFVILAIVVVTAFAAYAGIPPPFNKMIKKIARSLAAPGDTRVVIGGADTRTTTNGDTRVIQ